jgi:outer membrane protein OmpA-like peptidoglycan-associated protein
MNQIILQACIQLELKEITPQKYTELLVANSGRYLALLRGAKDAPQAEALASAASEGLPEGAPDITGDQITGEAEAVTATMQSQGMAPIYAEAVSEKDQLAAGGSERSRILVLIVSNDLTKPWPTIPPLPTAGQTPSTFALFDHDKAIISPRDEGRIMTFVANQCCANKFVVYGFADETGSDNHNRALARIRAAKVSDLIARIRPQVKVEQDSFGEALRLGGRLQDNRIVYVFAVQEPSRVDQATR